MPAIFQLSETGVTPGSYANANITVDVNGRVTAAANGAAVDGWEWLGEWDSLITYVANDVVSHEGSTYLCIVGNLNQEPPNGSYWALAASKGDTGPTGPTGAAGAAGAGLPAGGTTQQVLSKIDGADYNTEWRTLGVGSGDVIGPASATDNALVRYNTTTGKLVQDGLATLSDAGELVLPKGTITASSPHVLSETWNNVGVTFIGTDINVTDTFSATASRVLRVRVGGTVIAAVSKTQLISAAGSVIAGNAPGLTFEGFLDTGFGVNGDNLAFFESGTIVLNLSTLNTEFRIPSNFRYSWSSATNNNAAADTVIRRASAAVIALGIDASTPVHQQIKASDGSGTDRPGANLTLSAGRPTGSGTAGNLVFQVSTAGASGASIQSSADRMILSSVGEALKVMAAAAGVRGLAVKLAATPTANAIEIRDSTEAVLSYFDSRGAFVTPASTTAGASIIFTAGVAPSAPTDGMMWYEAAVGFRGRHGGATITFGSGGGGGVTDGDTLSTGFTFPVTGLHILDADASHDLIISPGSNLTADRTLTITTGDSNRTLTLTGNASIEGTNTGDVALAGSPSFITIAGQVITKVAIVTADVNTASNLLIRPIGFEIDGRSVVIATGLRQNPVTVPWNCTVTGWRIFGNPSGSIVVDVKKVSYASYPGTPASIAGSELPTLTAAEKNEDTSLTTWTTSLTAGDILKFEVVSATTVTYVRVELLVRLT